MFASNLSMTSEGNIWKGKHQGPKDSMADDDSLEEDLEKVETGSNLSPSSPVIYKPVASTAGTSEKGLVLSSKTVFNSENKNDKTSYVVNPEATNINQYGNFKKATLENIFVSGFKSLVPTTGLSHFWNNAASTISPYDSTSSTVYSLRGTKQEISVNSLANRETNYQSSSSSSSSFPFTTKEFNSSKIYGAKKNPEPVLIDDAFYETKKESNEVALKVKTDNNLNRVFDKGLQHKGIVSVFIGDLPKSIEERHLRELFQHYQSLSSVKVCKSFFTGELLGHGYLNFSNRDEALDAIERYNYIEMDGKEIRMMPSFRNSLIRKNLGTNVFFSELPFDTVTITTRDFYDIFKKYGTIYSCRLDKRKYIGFVYFQSEAVASKVISEYKNKPLFGAIIKCGIHFDKDVRGLPEFNKRISHIDKTKLVKERMLTEDNQVITSDQKLVDTNGNKLTHPNALYIVGLPPSFNNETTLEFFSKAGPIKSVHTCHRSKTGYRYAYVTYKKGSDCPKAISLFDEKLIKGRLIKVCKASQQKDVLALYQKFYESDINLSTYQEIFYEDAYNYKLTVYLSNLSAICSNLYITELCRQNNISFKEVKIMWFNKTNYTFAGYVNFFNNHEAEIFFNFLNYRLIGDAVAKCSWIANRQENLIVRLPRSPVVFSQQKQIQKSSVLSNISNNHGTNFNKKVRNIKAQSLITQNKSLLPSEKPNQ